MNDSDVYMTARGFIATHGTRVAWQHALARATEQSDLTDLANWLRIIDAIDELTRTERHPGEMIQ